jgi:hypothetical protein
VSHQGMTRGVDNDGVMINEAKLAYTPEAAVSPPVLVIPLRQYSAPTLPHEPPVHATLTQLQFTHTTNGTCILWQRHDGRKMEHSVWSNTHHTFYRGGCIQ